MISSHPDQRVFLHRIFNDTYCNVHGEMLTNLCKNEIVKMKFNLLCETSEGVRSSAQQTTLPQIIVHFSLQHIPFNQALHVSNLYATRFPLSAHCQVIVFVMFKLSKLRPQCQTSTNVPNFLCAHLSHHRQRFQSDTGAPITERS